MSNKLAINGGKPVRKDPISYSLMIEEEEINAVIKLLKTRKISALSSNIVKDFEDAFARSIGIKYCVAMNSGTAALHAAVASCLIGPGDEVIVPAYTFVSTATCILHNNAIPIFADIDPDTYCLDANDFEKKITDKTKAVIPVHLFGYPADMDNIGKIAVKNHLKVIEDAAQAHGTIYKGKKTGAIGDVGCFSLQESKNITTGEGGLLVTNDDTIAKQSKLIRHHGQSDQYKYISLGWNYRMTGMEAAIGLAQLNKLERLNIIRKQMAETYKKNLGHIEGFVLPKEPEKGGNHAYHVYAVRILQNKLGITSDKFVKAMAAEGIRAPLIYPEPLYFNPLFNEMNVYPKKCPYSCPYYGKKISYKPGLCPTAEKLTNEMIRLPLHPSISMKDIHDIIEAVQKIMNNKEELI